MYAYIDETGNTGENLFDSQQPVFMSASLITKTNFDILYKNKIKKLAKQNGAETIHANRLGMAKINLIAEDLLKALKASDARFYIARAEKITIVLTKLVDTIFGSGENLAVPWHVYTHKFLRLLLVMKMSYIVNIDILSEFWKCLMEKNKEKSYEQFIYVLSLIAPRVRKIPDKRSRTIITEAIDWAIKNSEEIIIHSHGSIERNGHLPNIAVFPELLGGIEKQSQSWNKPVIEIKHDQQSQFGRTLELWHDLFSNAGTNPAYNPGGEQYIFRRVFGSKFIMSSSEKSPGIQTVDVILWLLKRIDDGKPLTEESIKLMRYVLRMTGSYELSMESIIKSLTILESQIMNAPISAEQLERGQEICRKIEEGRQHNMRQYVEEKLLATTAKMEALLE